MVKFQKRLEGQLVPEWKEAYVNYKQLKKDLNQIRETAMTQQHIQQHHCLEPARDYNIPQEQTLSSFGSHFKAIGQLKHYRWPLWSPGGINMVIHLKRSDVCGAGEDTFETEFLGTTSQTEAQRIFFARLDGQLNMVNKFYKSKEHEYITRAAQLQKQIDVFIETRMTLFAQKCYGSPPTEGDDNDETKSAKNTKVKGKNCNSTYLSKTKLNRAGKMLRTAFIELYGGLCLLRNYSSLNMAAFTKILKKYDKITGQHASDVYLRAVRCSYFASSDTVLNVMDKVEALFTEHLTNNNHHEALAYLKPVPHSPDHKIIFLLGIFSGSSISLLVLFILLAALQRERNVLTASGYMQSVFQTFGTLALFLLHLYMYGCNVYIWQRVRINYTVIFEFAPGTELRFRDILLLSTGLTTIMLGGVVIQLIFVTVINTSIQQQYDVLPIIIMLVFCTVLFLPFDVGYKSTRFKFIQCVGHIICSPLYKVTPSEFFIADQFTSQVTAFRNLAWISCYYIRRHFKMHESAACMDDKFFQHFEYFLSVLPYWWRLMQCLRRWLDEGDHSHIANGGKYLSALLAIVIRLTFERNEARTWLPIFVISSTFATVYQLYWDIVVDWGFLQPKSVNPWLRDNLILRQKCIYFVFMGINTILRMTWLISAFHLHNDWIDHNVMDFVLASMEVSRRGLWNFLRLENEHFNNMAGCKATKSLRLSFKDLAGHEI